MLGDAKGFAFARIEPGRSQAVYILCCTLLLHNGWLVGRYNMERIQYLSSMLNLMPHKINNCK